MKSLKILKKVDIRVLQGLMMVLIVAVFLYLFYFFYSAFTQYRGSKQQEKRAGAPIEALSPPELFDFTPPKEDLNHYQLFLFKEKKVVVANQEGEEAMDQAAIENYLVMGVIKKDRLFLVVRMNANNEIRLFSQGMTIEDGFQVKSITLKQVIITNSNGSDRVYPVFQLEPVALGTVSAKEAGNKQ